MLWLPAMVLAAGGAQDLARQYRDDPSAATRAALSRFAAAHQSDQSGAQARLALGSTDYERAQYADALTDLQDLETRLPALTDYIVYLRSAAQYAAQRYGDAVSALVPLWSFTPASPVTPKAVLTAAHAYLDAKQPADAVTVLTRYIDSLPSPQGMFLLAQAAEAAGDPIAAATHYQSVYYWFPTTPEATQSEAALARLRQPLGDRFPPVTAATMIARADRLMTGGQPKEAKKEFEAIASQVGGSDRDVARVRMGEADYHAKQNQAAHDYLKSLSVADPEANAERLYWLLESARRLDREDEAREIAAELGRVAPSSQWRLKGVLAVANYFLVHNQPDQFVPLYRSCYEAFPSDPKAALCHWKVAWAAYMARQPESVEMMREHLKRYPTSSDNATGALYFLGRSAERAKSFDAAKAYYSELLERFPNHFHAVLARERMKDAAVARAAASADTVQFLRSVKFPPRAPRKPFESNAPTKVRIERARLLAGAGLDDWATTELRFGAKTDAQPVVAAVEIAELAQERGAYHQGVHAIKALAPDFLLMPLDAAPDKFWRLAFPMPYRAALEENSRERSLDPFLVAALIRQESEFNPEVVSHANAYGLTQVVPRTGREIARKLGSRRFSNNMLLDPATNIRLGTYYLRSMLDQLDGKIEPTLAAYNAGKSRAVNWLTFGQFEEPAEFVETIPFTETRTYVQLVLRNADVYRRLYGAK